MTLVLELPQDLEAELVAYWQRAGLLHTSREPADRTNRTSESDLDSSRFQLPDALQIRLHELLDRQDAGEGLTPDERLEAESLVELAEFLSLLYLRALRPTNQS